MEQNLRGPCPYVWTGIKSPFCFMSYRASRLNSRCYTPHIWAKSLLMPQYCIVNMLCVWKVILAVSWETLQAFSLEVLLISGGCCMFFLFLCVCMCKNAFAFVFEGSRNSKGPWKRKKSTWRCFVSSVLVVSQFWGLDLLLQLLQRILFIFRNEGKHDHVCHWQWNVYWDWLL